MITYTVPADIALFRADYLPYPAGGLIFWSQQQAGGVLLLPGIHYAVIGPSFVLVAALPIAPGDTIAVIG